ncbi:expressed unknown protein [Seminavis robusta]|uniref:Uncharacterized protein n=1 Tax=Seminavis robusta TaxID=568900 RepID=A0A9N8D8D0_9STRA|nr:expressed unknown protein [Seminavis robusta]|eukprot:Sro33_g021670.1 n/a (240) ;mRNA; r:134501-135220
MVKINAKNSSVPVQGVKVAQSNATKIWGISGEHLKYKMTKNETKGRCVLYDLEDVIQAALQRKQTNCRYNRDLSGLPKVLERLDKCDDDNARNQLAAFYRRKLDLFLPEVVELVAKEMIQTVRAEIKQAERKIANKKSNLGAFQVLSRGKKDISDDEENDSKVEYSDDDEEGKKRKATPSPKTTVKRKKRKTVLHNGTIWGDNDEDFTPALEHHKTIKVTPITTRKTRSATRRAIADEK